MNNKVILLLSFSLLSLIMAGSLVSATDTLATGGSISFSGGYTYHTFTTGGTFVPVMPMTVDVLVVGGGGGAGYEGTNTARDGGGGGAGGLVYITNYSVTPGSYSVTVGSGGAGSSDHAVKGTNGGNSTFGSLVAIGGGGGGSRDTRDGASGGSGGGGGCQIGISGSGGSELQTSASGDSGTYGYGNDGANSVSDVGGGGGGSGGSASAPTGGAGTSVFGSTYAVGGSADSGGTDGAANTGNGGDAGYDTVLTVGGDGGSGIVIVRYPTDNCGNYRSYTNCTAYGCFKIVNSLGNPMAIIDGAGFMDIDFFLFENVDLSSYTPPTYSLSFFNSSGRAALMQINGHFIIGGTVTQDQQTYCTPSEGSFVIRDNSGNCVFYINKTGDVWMRGRICINASSTSVFG